MEFKTLNNLSQLEEIDLLSKGKKQIIFKHSTRCPVSGFAKRTLVSECSDYMDKLFDIHYLDLLNYRDISKAIESRYAVRHESPQILVIEDGVCIYHASHDRVSMELAIESISK